LSSNEDPPVGAEADAALGERGTEEVATELFEAGLIVWGDRDAGAARTVVSAETSGYPLDPLVYKRARAAARKVFSPHASATALMAFGFRRDEEWQKLRVYEPTTADGRRAVLWVLRAPAMFWRVTRAASR
jgi:hypothetical protein